MKLQDYKEEYEQIKEKKCLSGNEAIEAVKKNGYALRYVNSDFFEKDEVEKAIKLLTERGKLVNGKILTNN